MKGENAVHVTIGELLKRYERCPSLLGYLTNIKNIGDPDLRPTLYTIRLTESVFSKLLFQPLGPERGNFGKLIENGRSIEKVCNYMRVNKLTIEDLRPEGAYYDPWMDKVLASYGDDFDYDKFTPLVITEALEWELANDIGSKYRISDGNHHAFAMALTVYLGRLQEFQPVEAIIVQGDRKRLSEELQIEI